MFFLLSCTWCQVLIIFSSLFITKLLSFSGRYGWLATFSNFSSTLNHILYTRHTEGLPVKPSLAMAF